MDESWGNVVRPEQFVHRLSFRDDLLPPVNPLLPVGKRRSYGDVCTNHNGNVIDATGLDRFINFDRESGLIRCEAGVTLWQIQMLTVPHGWFLSVTPGTSFVTVGGAIANDVHGKNHHVSGSFGCFVERLELRRTDGSALLCSRDSNADWFSATVGGLGLTGLISWAELKLQPISTTSLAVESIEYGNFQEFMSLSKESEHSHDYHVSWVDCLEKGARRGSGIFLRANHNTDGDSLHRKLVRARKKVPDIVGKGPTLINPISLRLFNRLYRYRNSGTRVYREPLEKYFYPLDGLIGWNRIYGRKGFYQFQCVIPFENTCAIDSLLQKIESSGQGSFLSVMKIMGSIPSPGMIAFSRPGVTLALDFPNLGDRTLKLLKTLEEIVVDARGAIYPAKDATMTSAAFRAGYDKCEAFSAYIDPGISSDFWRRVFS